MIQFDDAFLDVNAFMPPGKWQARVSNLLVWLLVAMLLVAGWFFIDIMLSQFRYLALAEGAPAIPYPAQWQPQPAHDLALQAFDPESPPPFIAREDVAILPLPAAPIALAWPEQRQKQWADYHETERLLVTLNDGRQALLLAYTHGAGEDGPVVVRAIDLAFAVNDGQAERLVVLTLAAADDDWERVAPVYQRILDKMGVVTP